MLIPKHYRKHLRAIGHHHWFWVRIPNWAFGERCRFRDASIAYLYGGEVITIRKGNRALWRKDNG